MVEIRRFFRCLVSVFRGGRAEDDLTREIDAHLRLLEDQFMAEGMSAEEARFAARRAFGGVEQVKEHLRDERSFRWMGNSWLDLQLGARMLVRCPGLTLAGGLGMAVAIAISAGAFSIVHTLLHPTLALHEGDRIVTIQNWDVVSNGAERRALHDFVTWRDELTSIGDVGAFRQVSRNLIAPGAPPEPIRVAEMTASGFRVARVSPILARPLLAGDERPAAEPVVVIGHHLWRTRFAGDPCLVGKTIQLGEAGQAAP